MTPFFQRKAMKRSGMFLIALIIGLGLVLVVGSLVASALDDPNRIGFDPARTNLPRVTFEQNGQTLRMSANEGFLLDLGADYLWAVSVDNPAVVTQDLNIAVGQDLQGIYRAAASGKAVLSAVGKPNCPKTNLSCNQPDRAFSINIVVE
jgi:hypothetical protein